jgi:hypothetical protein
MHENPKARSADQMRAEQLTRIAMRLDQVFGLD